MTVDVALYSAVENVFTQYDVDVAAATLTPRRTTEAAAKVQYAWRHPTQRILYVTTSSGGPHVQSDFNRVSAFSIADDGTLSPHGKPAPLDRRATHMCVHPSGRYALNAHNYPTGDISVHAINADGTLGSAIAQRPSLRAGIYPHQVLMFPSGNTALVVDRGNSAREGRPEDPGALRIFDFADGVLNEAQVVAPGGGYGFGPRHVDFHPTQPWIYVSDERTNRLHMFRYAGERLEEAPAYTLSTLADPAQRRTRQLAGAIHIHPSGGHVYVANRADGRIEFGSQQVFSGGENSIAVFAIDSETGEPKPIQHAETHSFHVRTFALDPDGRLLVTASIKAHAVREGNAVKPVPAALSVFRIDDDGRLEFARQYDVATPGDHMQYWVGMIRLS